MSSDVHVHHDQWFQWSHSIPPWNQLPDADQLSDIMLLLCLLLKMLVHFIEICCTEMLLQAFLDALACRATARLRGRKSHLIRMDGVREIAELALSTSGEVRMEEARKLFVILNILMIILISNLLRGWIWKVLLNHGFLLLIWSRVSRLPRRLHGFPLGWEIPKTLVHM